MTDPGNLTWHRWYASLLRTCGADLADPEDVRRRLAALDGAPLPDGVHRADLMGRTALADVLLSEALTRAYVRDAEAPPAAGPLLTDHAVATGIAQVAAALQDRWTAAGLAEQLAGPYARFAPGPDAFPHLVLADALLDEHLDHYGDVALPVPPPPAVEAGPFEEDADALIAAVEELTEEEFEPYGGEAPHLLYVVYRRGCSAESVARKAAEYEDWAVDPDLEDVPVPVPAEASPGPYATPPLPELVRLVGTAELTEADRARLEGPARDLAVVVDRLAATGLVFRAGDAFGLTPRGAGVVRYLLGVRGSPHPTSPRSRDGPRPTSWPPPVAGPPPSPRACSPTGCTPAGTAPTPGPSCSPPSAPSTPAPPTPPPSVGSSPPWTPPPPRPTPCGAPCAIRWSARTPTRPCGGGASPPT